MGDRELLELAAKAAGVTGGWGENIEYHNGAVDLRDIWILEGDDFVPWNPLADDGDAFRLAVKLMLSITIGPCQVQAVSISGALRGEFPKEDAIYQDMGIATRRAIVRAAAEIGRTK